MRLIYAFNPNDPSSDSSSLAQHTVRGSKSVHLLSPPREEQPKVPADAFSYDFLNTNVSLTDWASLVICANVIDELDMKYECSFFLFNVFTRFQGRPLGNVDTTYWCEAFKPPSLNTKHHIVMVISLS